MSFVFTFLGGKHVTDIDSITLVNNTALAHDIVVPVGKRWRIFTVKAINCDDVTRAISFDLYNEAAATHLIGTLSYKADVGAGGEWVWPNSTYTPFPLILSQGQLIRINFAAGGASSGGGPDADGVVVTLLEIDV